MGVEPPLFVARPPQKVDDPPALDPRQPPDPDRILPRRRAGPKHLAPGWESFPERGVGAIAIRVAGVLREDGEDQLVQRRPALHDPRPAEQTFETIEHRSHPSRGGPRDRGSGGGAPSTLRVRLDPERTFPSPARGAPRRGAGRHWLASTGRARP